MYEDFLKEHESSLEGCIGLVNCSKIRMYRPGGDNYNQPAVNSGHNRVHRLIYQTLSTEDGLKFSLYG